MGDEHRQCPLRTGAPSRSIKFGIEGIGPWEITVPHSVYPPREDTSLIGRALLELSDCRGIATEIGCGSGVLSILLASMGWEVAACDVNPFAVAAARGNVEAAGFVDVVSVEEGGPGELGWELQRDVTLVVWNLPYLDPPEQNDAFLDPIEEASVSDLPGGWSNSLLEIMDNGLIDPNCLVVLLHRIDPDSRSKPISWIRNGWSCRRLDSMRLGNERLEVLSYWRPAAGNPAIVINECESTMDEAKRLTDGKGWQRVLSLSQTSGRGRRGNSWQTQEGGLACTWVLSAECLKRYSSGLIQTVIGAAVSDALGCFVKWPNDLVTGDGRKLGGILVEGSSTDDGIRIGIGINRHGGVVDGTSVAGWNEFIGEKSVLEVFEILDPTISSLFEEHILAPSVERDELIALSWKSLSRLLSTGARLRSNGTYLRAVGLNMEGHLLTESGGETSKIDDVSRLNWTLIP